MRTFQVLVILAGMFAFLLGLRVFGRSFSSTRWPVTQGRVVRSHILPAGDDRFRVVIQYEFILAGKVYSGSGIDLPSVSGVLDSMRGPLLTRSAADSMITAYPVGREIAVGFDPGDPRQSVLRPRLRWWSLLLALGGSALLVGGIWGRRIVFHRASHLPTGHVP